jgi:triphosphoribosyl-dephospho-CoA synthase
MADSNIYHRGGREGAELVRKSARRFMALGGTAHSEWRDTALEYHRLFISLRLSPGGAADLLAASWFVHQVTEGIE